MALVMWAMTKLNPGLKVTWYLKVESAGTESDVIFTQDKDKIEEILQALNTQRICRSVVLCSRTSHQHR